MNSTTLKREIMKKVLFLMSVFLFLLSGAVLAQQSRMLSVEKIKTERAALKKQSFDYKSLKWNRIKKTDQYQAKVDFNYSKR